MTLRDARILVTGATGQVALPVALGLAADNDVIAVARFKDTRLRARLEAVGVHCVSVDLAQGALTDVPADKRQDLPVEPAPRGIAPQGVAPGTPAPANAPPPAAPAREGAR